MQLNVNIKLIRELSGKKQPEFADIIGTNLSNLKTYETTDVRPKANILAKIADYAGITVEKLEEHRLTHKDIIFNQVKSKKDIKVTSRETYGLELNDDGGENYKSKYISLLEKENSQKDNIINLSLTELVMGQRISQAHLKSLLQITVTETAAMQGKDPLQALSAANKVVADAYSAILKKDNDGSR